MRTLLNSILNLVLILTLLTSCGGNNGNSATSGPTSLSSLPAATGPVGSSGGSGSGIRSLRVYGAVSPTLFAASSGVKLSQFSSVSWNNTKSAAMCEAGNQIRNLWRDASDPDKIGCYLGIMESEGLFASPFDGNEKIYSLSQSGSGFKIKFVATKNEAGAITSFRMFECGADNSQRGYTSKSIVDGQVDITAMYSFSESGYTGTNRTTVSGLYDADTNSYTNKTIVGTTSNAQTSGTPFSNSETITAVQSNGQITLTGYASGSYNSTDFSKAQVAIIQTLNESQVSTFAIGDGAAKINFNYGVGAQTGTIYWTGDTQANGAENDLAAAISVESVPTIQSITAPSFSSEESWDCSGDPIGVIDLDTLDMSQFNACDAKFSFSDNSWVDCSNADFD